MISLEIIERMKTELNLTSHTTKLNNVVHLNNKHLKIHICDTDTKDWFYEEDLIFVSHQDLFNKVTNSYIISEYPKCKFDVDNMILNLKSLVGSKIHYTLDTDRHQFNLKELDTVNKIIKLTLSLGEK